MYPSRGARILVHKDKPIGISLGAEATSEHEDGFGPPLDFGLRAADEGKPVSQLGNKKVPEGFHFLDKGEVGYLVYCGYHRDQPRDQWFEDIIGIPDEHRPLVAAWDDESFGVGVHGRESTYLLKRLYDAAQKNDLAVLFGAVDYVMAFLGCNGPVLLIASECPVTA